MEQFIKKPVLFVWLDGATFNWVVVGYKFNIMNIWHELAASLNVKDISMSNTMNYMTKDLPKTINKIKCNLFVLVDIFNIEL